MRVLRPVDSRDAANVRRLARRVQPRRRRTDLSLLDATGETVVGAGADGRIWRRTAAGGWEQIAPADGPVHALAATDTGAIVVDGRGILRIEGDETIIVRSAD